MAKSVADLIVALEVKGIEGVSQLKSSLRGLSKAAGPADKDLEQIRRSVTAFAKAGQLSRQSIAGQIEAFKGLRQQATIGSSVYRKLGKDIDGLTQSLDRLNRKEEEASKKPRSPKQIFNDGVAVYPEKFNKQVAAGNQILQSLKVTSQEYGQQLANVTVRTQEFTRAQQRQQVIAQNLVAANRAQTTGFLQSSKVNIENTHTLSALKQKISELAQDVDNLDVGSKEYTSTSRLLKNAQEELNQVLGVSSRAFDDLTRAQERSERRARKLAGIQSAGKVGSAGTRDPKTGAMIAGGAVPPMAMQGLKAPRLNKVARSYEDVANNIRKVALASNGSTRSLDAQRNSWASLRAGLDPASKSYREVGKEIDKVDRRLAKLNKRRGLSAQGATQVAGAAISGGIFGGPEGALGALGGAAFGGVQGAFAGAAIGAQVGGLRKSIGATAEYAAQIEKLKIGLRGVVDSEVEFKEAMKVANSATKDFNISALDSIKGVTRLSAAVLGAKGNLTDVEIVFRGISSAVLATGGSADDVRSAITAMVQVFSKGKVSAEELSGQLGERLPGAVVRFAKAAYGEGPAAMQKLQKELKAGSVGLNELMLFAEASGTEFEELAKKIAGSSASAGARLNILVDAFRLELGTAIQPVGAQIQDFAGKILVEFKDEIIGVVKGLGDLVLGLLALAKFIGDNKEVIGFFTKAALKIAAVKLALDALASVRVVYAGLIAAGTQAKITGDVSAIAAGKVGLLSKALGSLALIGIVTVGADVVITGYARLQSTLKELRKLKAEVGGGAAKRFAGEDYESAVLRKDTAASTIAAIQREQRERASVGGRTKQVLTALVGGIPGFSSIPALSQATEAGRGKLLERRLTAATQNISLPLPEKPKPRARTQYELLLEQLEEEKEKKNKGTGSGKTPKSPTDISDLQLQARLAARIAARTDATIEQRKKALELERESAVLASEELTTNKQIDAVHKAADKFRRGMLKIETEIVDKKKEEAKAVADLNDARMQLQARLGLTTKQEQVKTAQDSFKQAHPGATDQDLDLIRQTIDPTLFEQGTAQIRKMREELAELLNPINQVTGAANAIGTAFTDSFKSVIDGSATTQEALAGFFRNIGNYFLDMAMQIIQKMITMYILNQVVGLLPGFSGGGVFNPGAPSLTGNKIGDFGGGNSFFAKGGAFAKNKIVPYAKGGIVNKPTMFAYANGGAGRFGLMGEAGPEAILPLQRGPGGKLGVQASGGGVSVGNINITVENTGDKLNPAAQKQLAGQVQGIVLSTLANERRSGGML